MRLFGTDPLLYLILLVGLAFSMFIGFVAQQRFLMPVASALILWPMLIWSLRHARIDVAVRLVTFWAVVIFVVTIIASRVLGARAQETVPGGLEYIANQMLWLTGRESTVEGVSNWLPELARRTGLVLAGGAISAGLLPLIAAARWLAILGLWTANLFNAAHPLLAIPLSISPWTWAEIVAQAALLIVMAEPIVTGNVHGLLTRDRSRLLLTGLIALLLAIALHLLLPRLLASPLRALVL